MNRAFPLHAADPGSVSGILCDSQSLLGVIFDHKASVPPGVAPK